MRSEPKGNLAIMIMETAFMEIVPGKELEFEAAMEQAKAVVSQAKGFQVIHVHRGVEKPSTYLIAIGWDTVEDHMVGFRESELFTQWRGLIGPFFANPPEVTHWELHA
jgi:heme-degrading monooxygenase HmoA